MAATNVKVLNPGDRTFLAANAIGTGAPADTDLLSTDVVTYSVGSTYFDTTNNKLWRRRTESTPGVAADWVGVVLS